MLSFDDAFRPVAGPTGLDGDSRLRARIRLLAFRLTPRTRVARALAASWVLATIALFGLGGASASQVEAVPATVVAPMADGGCVLLWRDGLDSPRTTWLSHCPDDAATGSELIVHRSPVWDGAPFWDGAELRRGPEVWRSLVGLPVIGSLMLGGIAVLAWATRRAAPQPGGAAGMWARRRRRDRPA